MNERMRSGRINKKREIWINKIEKSFNGKKGKERLVLYRNRTIR